MDGVRDNKVTVLLIPLHDRHEHREKDIVASTKPLDGTKTTTARRRDTAKTSMHEGILRSGVAAEVAG